MSTNENYIPIPAECPYRTRNEPEYRPLVAPRWVDGKVIAVDAAPRKLDLRLVETYDKVSRMLGLPFLSNPQIATTLRRRRRALRRARKAAERQRR